jgi:CO/xanthine dehydrogenase FAD-binding subunit
MRAFVPDFDIISPKNLSHALRLIERGARPFAGGTDIMVLFAAGRLDEKSWVNLWDLEEIKGIKVGSETVTLGALTTFRQIQSHSTLKRHFPLLCLAAKCVGAPAIQNRATIAGNIMNASPAGDSMPALLVYDAEVELSSSSGRRWVSYRDFHTGYKTTIAQHHEILTRIRLPILKRGARNYYRKVGCRDAQAISKVSVCALAFVHGSHVRGARVAMGAVAPTAVRCTAIENILENRASVSIPQAELSDALFSCIQPIDDIRSTASYRRNVARNCLFEFIGSLHG